MNLVCQQLKIKLHPACVVEKKNLFMKKTFFLFAILVVFYSFSSDAQQVHVRLDFPIGVSVNPPGHPPFRGAIWIGPEWRWQRGAYVVVPGYWSKPKGRHHHWKNGHWKRNRHGYC